MKKIIFSFVVLFAIMASVNAQVAPSFNEAYQQVLKLNVSRFSDVNKIQIGDTVLFPSLSGPGTEFLIADSPANGIHDCLYLMTGKYLAGKLVTQPVPEIVKPVPPVIVEPIKESNPDFWAWFILIGLALLVIAAYLLNRFRPWNSRCNLNRHPMIDGGLSNDAAEAAAQISALIPSSAVKKSERGYLICASPVKVEMNFSDGIKRIKIISGEIYYRITQEDGIVRYARAACGNLVTGSIRELPKDVTFVPSTEENASWEREYEVEVVEEVAVEKPVPAKVVDLETEPKTIVEIIKTVGEMVNVPVKFTYKDLVIDFEGKNEKVEDK